MANIKLKNKVIALLMFSMALLSVCVALISNYYIEQGFNAYAEEALLSLKQVVDAKVQTQLEDYKKFSKLIASDPALTELIKAKKTDELKKYAKSAMQSSGATLLVISDDKADVLARGHSNKIGDNIGNQHNLQKALSGENSSGLEEGTVVKFSFRGAAPIYDNNKIIGAVVLGRDLSSDTNFVDDVKKEAFSECTIFAGDTRVVTTIVKDGKRAIGTKMDNPKVIENVLKNGGVFNSENKILGKLYSTIYWPIKNHKNEIRGMFFLGKSKDGIMSAKNKVFSMLMITEVVFTLIISVLIWIFLSKSISKIIEDIKNEARRISDQIASGILSSRANPASVSFEFAEVVEGYNKVIDSVLPPLLNTADLIRKLADGVIPDKIEEEYKGDFNAIKLSVNQLICSLDKVTSIAKSISKGDVSQEVRLRSDSDELMKALMDMCYVINDMTSEVDRAVLNIINGDLNFRADSSRLNGDFKKIIDGLNSALTRMTGLIDAIPLRVQIVGENHEVKYSNRNNSNIIK
jgi:methyl-accepting chemotaxis protein